MQDIQATLQQSLELEKAHRYAEALRLVHKARHKQMGHRGLAIRHAQLLELNKQFDNALSLYRSLDQVLPKEAKREAVLVLGTARTLLRKDGFEEAEKLFKILQPVMPDHPDVLTGLATLHRQREELAEAEARIEQVLAKDPLYRPAIHELAQIQFARKQDEQAIQTLERNVFRHDLFGDSIDLWLATLKRLKRDRYTQDHLERLCREYPDLVEFVFGLGVVAHRSGEIPVARPAMAQADKLSPDNFRILHEWGVLERIAGDSQLSQKLLERSLELHPEQPSALRTFGTEHKYQYGDAAFARLNLVAARLADVSVHDQIHLHYAMGKSFEDVDELDTAFRHYQTGGDKKLKQEPFDDRDSQQTFAVLKQVVTAATLAEKPEPGCDSELPVLILGMPRSGTSLLEQILSSHPDIFGAGELKYLVGVLDNIEIAGRRISLGEPEPIFDLKEKASWQQRGQRYVERLEKLSGKSYKRVIDKMPGNFTMAGMVPAILPKARIIHSRRHPVETCLSSYRIHFAEGQLWSYDLRTLGRYYRRYWDLMKFWREQFPGMMYEVRYEDNVADVEQQARKLIDFLGLDWNPSCLEFYNSDRPVKTASASQVKKPIYTTSTNRWRRFEKYLTPLLDEIGDIVEEYEAEIAHLAVR